MIHVKLISSATIAIISATLSAPISSAARDYLNIVSQCTGNGNSVLVISYNSSSWGTQTAYEARPCAETQIWHDFFSDKSRAEYRYQICLNREENDHLDNLEVIHNLQIACSAAVGTTLLYCLGSSAPNALPYYPGPMPVLPPSAFSAALSLPAPRVPTSCFGVALFEEAVCWTAYLASIVLENQHYEGEKRICLLNRNQEISDAARRRDVSIARLWN